MSIYDAALICAAHGHPVRRAYQSGTGPRFVVQGVYGDVSAFGLVRLAEGLGAKRT